MALTAFSSTCNPSVLAMCVTICVRSASVRRVKRNTAQRDWMGSMTLLE
ncbi:Uncharacterised protein [uncultured archaeon]|nr:Uncharacterised protein [uncultured archaeon]